MGQSVLMTKYPRLRRVSFFRQNHYRLTNPSFRTINTSRWDGIRQLLRYREWDFLGILNGIDYSEFNPEADALIVKTFSTKNLVSGKKANREALFSQLGIKNRPGPLFSVVTRITWQKGFDIVFPALELLLEKGANYIILGSGEKQYIDKLNELKSRHPNQIGLYFGYSDSLAHLIYAASDFFIMPSLFEPCGLGQMIAQRYGALPIVRRTGGLRDSVICYNGTNLTEANGFGFDAYNANEMTRTALYALDTYNDKTTLRQLMKNALILITHGKRAHKNI